MARAFRGPLLRWFRGGARDLPWRRTRDPYRILVAEFLLQQTRVDQALPFYHRFLARFPDLPSLARAPEGSVLKAWEGAGYYARARHLRELARTVVKEHGGVLPDRVDRLRELPGVGEYTARAVAAIAFHRRVVAVDANVRRVLTRVLYPAPLEDARAEALLGRADPRAFNEGLMELGQRVCTARDPRCPRCPVRVACGAYRELSDPGRVPRRTPRPARPRVRAAVGLLFRDGRFLVQRRAPRGLLGGLWEFPGGKVERGEAPARAVRREFLEETGLRVKVLRALGVLEHDYSHFHVSLHVFALSALPGPRQRTERYRWVTLPTLRRLPLPSATRRMLPWAAALASRATVRRARGSA
jgi:A/G-specific adenine glycosylase